MRSNVVWTLVYTNRNGVDCWVADEFDTVQEKALKIVAAFRDHYEIPDHVSNEEALEDWGAWSGGAGFIEVVRADVLEKRPTPHDQSFEEVKPPQVEEPYIPTEDDLKELARVIEDDILSEILGENER